jgi:iron-sulfur cluster repair protein YtfE (RIC family)
MSSRPPDAQAALDTVTGYLSWDHDRLDGLLDRATRHVWEAQWLDASQAFGEFERGLDRHIRVEEEVLFPLFEARTGIVGGPTAVLRAEHREIRQGLALMRRGVDAEDPRAFEEGLAFLRSVLPAHNAKEEHILYPTVDRVLAPKEREAVAARLRRN